MFSIYRTKTKKKAKVGLRLDIRNIHNEIHGVDRGGKIAAWTVAGRIENTRKKYSRDSGEPAGRRRFWILHIAGGDEGGAREKNSRVSASRLRSNKDANYCLARARRKRSSAAAPPKSGREFTFGMWSELKRICTYGVFYNRKYYGRFGEWGSRRKSKSNTGADGIIQTFAGTFYEYITRCVFCMKHFETWSTS